MMGEKFDRSRDQDGPPENQPTSHRSSRRGLFPNFPIRSFFWDRVSGAHSTWPEFRVRSMGEGRIESGIVVGDARSVREKQTTIKRGGFLGWSLLERQDLFYPCRLRAIRGTVIPVLGKPLVPTEYSPQRCFLGIHRRVSTL